MSLHNSILPFMVVIGLLLLFYIVFTPMRFHVYIARQTVWNCSVTVQIWGKEKTIIVPNCFCEKMTQYIQEETDPKSMPKTLTASWQSLLPVFYKGIQFAVQQISMEKLKIHCVVGWERADYTAWSYGCFWAMVSFLPKQWLKNSEIYYFPNFKEVKKEICLQGIIRLTIGQLIRIVVMWCWLVLQFMLEQNRKEQVRYES